jgi:hypothetical protein
LKKEKFIYNLHNHTHYESNTGKTSG